ncbi:hypothetical protein L0Y65_03455 [Candidatus Micrarchaeota archaeon]|nr:hypothetical protein [Candidatus Micrarchaeota archaeon]
MAFLCDPEFGTFFSENILPLLAYAGSSLAALLGIAYMAGTATSNAKLTLWSKTEAVQFIVSTVSVFLIITTMNTFCSIKINEIAAIFDMPASADNPDIYGAARGYLNDAAIYSHNALTVVRYHLESYTTLSFFNAFICDLSTGRIGWGCLFGYSGVSQQPLGGYAVQTAAMNIFFNGAIIAHFMSLNFIFILLFVYKGFVFLFLPLGVFMRSMPYMRSFGSLLVALAISFLIVYPFLLAVFYLMRNVLVDADNGYTPLSEPMSTYNTNEERMEGYVNGGDMLAMSTGGESFVKGCYFDRGGCYGSGVNIENMSGAIGFASNAFVAAIFFPSIALLATIASVGYIARLYGEEIDLSRITQLV